MSIFKKKPAPAEKRFNLGRPGEVLFQNTADQDAFIAEEAARLAKYNKVMFTPVSVLAVQGVVAGVKAGVQHHRDVKEEGRSKLWDA